MDWINLISLVINALFGGGLFLGFFTVKSQRKKAEAEAEAAEIDNDKKASETILEFVVKPLKEEIDELRKETGGLRRDVRKLQKAIGKIGDCAYADGCPVRRELQNHDPVAK
ncbi:MAG: hypothetical protein LBG92_03080 [Prevotellaceae bacterium]|jgi:hypothetical protein|nr:hypothetical protein [Prevotellaceae bacterium]